ncbi:MAG: BON domain-containing protein [Proteobacteria bacterium]|nr:BON domain-containing protein [Pseudomonadota bacterium]
MPVAVTGVVATATYVVLDDRMIGVIVDDNVIFTKIKSAFASRDLNNLFMKISVLVHEGRVMLTGTLRDQKYIDTVLDIVWSIEGVKEVLNELQIADMPLNKSQDIYLATKIKSHLIVAKDVNSNNYITSVNDGVVYLLGVAKNKEERDMVISIIEMISGINRIVSHVILKSDSRRG